jgi:hypothetical protein
MLVRRQLARGDRAHRLGHVQHPLVVSPRALGVEEILEEFDDGSAVRGGTEAGVVCDEGGIVARRRFGATEQSLRHLERHEARDVNVERFELAAVQFAFEHRPAERS